MTIQLFLFLLLLGSVFSSLFTQAVKQWCKNANINYSANIIALFYAVVFGLFGAIFAYLYLDIQFTLLNIFAIIALILCNWIGCMIGYDKVIQSIEQLFKKEE